MMFHPFMQIYCDILMIVKYLYLINLYGWMTMKNRGHLSDKTSRKMGVFATITQVQVPDMKKIVA